MLAVASTFSRVILLGARYRNHCVNMDGLKSMKRSGYKEKNREKKLNANRRQS